MPERASRTPETSGNRAPETPGDRAPETPGGRAPGTPGDRAPETPRGRAPETPGDRAPETPGDRASETPEARRVAESPVGEQNARAELEGGISSGEGTEEQADEDDEKGLEDGLTLQRNFSRSKASQVGEDLDLGQEKEVWPGPSQLVHTCLRRQSFPVRSLTLQPVGRLNAWQI